MWTPENWYEEARKLGADKREHTRRKADHLLATYRRVMPELSAERIAEKLMAFNSKRLDAVPELAKYPELRGMRDLVEAEWRGMRDGAELSDAQWAVTCDYLYFYKHNLESLPSAMHGCSGVFFPRSDRGPILAANLDTTPDEPFEPPQPVGLNEHMFFVGVSCGIYGDEQPREIFPAPVFKLVGRYCRCTDEAVELLTRYNHFWGPGNGLLADRDGNTVMLEKSSCRIGVRRSPDGFGFITAMTMEEPSMNAYLADRRAASLVRRGLPEECADTAYWRGADDRRQLMNELLDEARRNQTLEQLRSFVQFRDPGRGIVCCNGEVLFPGGPKSEYTICTTIWILSEGRAMWWAMEGDTPSFENRKEDVVFSDVSRWNQAVSR